jgi:hypothetical protein
MIMILSIMLVQILIHVVRFVTQPTMEVNIRNQCSKFKLIEVPFFGGPYLAGLPCRKIDAGKSASDHASPMFAASKSFRLYELRRKDSTSSNQLNLAYNYLLVIWKSEGYMDFRVRAYLIDCDGRCVWYMPKLIEHYQKHVSRSKKYTTPIVDTWLICKDTILKTVLIVDDKKRDGRLHIVITEEAINNHTRKLLQDQLTR